MAKASEYEWSSGAKKHGFGKCDPGKTATFLKKLEREGRLDRATVRSEAEKAANPLHGGVQWYWGNDAEAAEEWRLQVASAAISGLRQIVVAKVDGVQVREPMPVFVSTEGRRSSVADEGHRSISEVMADPLARARYLTRMLMEIRALERQYSVALSAFPKVAERWEALRHAIEKELPPAT